MSVYFSNKMHFRLNQPIFNNSNFEKKNLKGIKKNLKAHLHPDEKKRWLKEMMVCCDVICAGADEKMAKIFESKTTHIEKVR